MLANWRAEVAEALVVLDETAEAQRLAREQLELSEELGAPGARGAALRVLARTVTEPIPRSAVSSIPVAAPVPAVTQLAGRNRRKVALRRS